MADNTTGFRLEAFIDALGEGVYAVDRAGNCLFLNASALRILRYDRSDDLLGRNMHEAIHHTRLDGTLFPQSACPLLHTSKSGQPVRLDNELLWRSDGTSFFAEYSSYPVFEDGIVVGSVITFTENEVRQDARVRLAVQHAVSQILVGARRAQMMTQVVQAVARGFGWDVGLFWRQEGTVEQGLRLATWSGMGDQVQASGLAESSADLVLHADDRLAGQAWATRRAVHLPDLGTESCDRRLDRAARAFALRSAFAFPIAAGSRIFGAVEFYSRARIDVDGTLLEAVETLGQMIGQALDRQSTASSLRKSESRFRIMSNAIPQLSWTAAPDGAVDWYNDRWYEFTGTTPWEMAGTGWLSVHHPEHVDRVKSSLTKNVLAGEAWEETFPLRGADGEYRWFLSRAVPIRSDGEDGRAAGDILGWFGTNTDITAMRVLEQSQTDALNAAEAANEAKSLFLANMSHELRTPLSAIIGYSEMLVEEVEDGAPTADVVRDIRTVESNARHLLGLINDVLDLSKVESGKMEAFAETFDVARLVEEMAATVASLVEQKHNRLEVRTAANVGVMHTDTTRVRQVLLNLVGNAAKFTEGGTITLATHRYVGPGSKDWLSFAVSDTGLGMSDNQIAQLFQRFHQADASTTRRFGGTGLGLSLTKAFSELLGGRVEVRSSPGLGSTFTMHIPAVLSRPGADEVVGE